MSKQVPAMHTRYYQVLHAIERIHESTAAPVTATDLRAAVAAQTLSVEQTGAWLTKFQQRGLIRRQGAGVVPAWADDAKHIGTCEAECAS